MPTEGHSEHVVRLPLHPVGRIPQGRDAGDLQVVQWKLGLQAKLPPVTHRPELVPQAERAPASQVHGRQVGEEVVCLPGVLLQVAQDVESPLRIDAHDGNADRVRSNTAHGIAEFGMQSADRGIPGASAFLPCPDDERQ